MTTRENFGWHDDLRCPPWCVLSDDLGHRVDHGLSDFWHRGAATPIPTTDEDGEDGEIDEGEIAEVYLSQRVQVDGRGSNTHRADVVLGLAGAFTPNNARALAKALSALADDAEADTEWRIGQGFNPGPFAAT